MNECRYTLREMKLTRDEIREIWAYYDQFLIEEQIWANIQNDYRATDISLFEHIISDIAHSYNKNREYGCDEEFSMEEAFVDHHEKIEKLV